MDDNRLKTRGYLLFISCVIATAVSVADDTLEIEQMINDFSSEQLAFYEAVVLYDFAIGKSPLGDYAFKTCATPSEPYMPHLSWLMALYGEPDFNNENVLTAMQVMIDNGCDIDDHQHAGMSPLHEAILLKHDKVIEFLLLNGADKKDLINRPGQKSDQLNAIEFAHLLYETTGMNAYLELVELLED
ncbi:hypothetical protein [Reinekea sp.]|jgi:hypothetical protein|uniref:hypothetical protein n=1 Tax=Reinekea sp. TaxID=1970455 RepID=UPI0039895BE4